MKSIDEFDEFLKDRFQRIYNNVEDEGFTEKVLANLPESESSLKRNLILYLACIVSVSVFIISSGYKSLLMSINDIARNGLHSTQQSLIPLVVVAVFISISFCIAGVEYHKN